MSNILTETLGYSQAELIYESDKNDTNQNGQKKLYMQGIFIQGDVRNLNERIYPVSEIRKAVTEINERLENFSVCGELDHPAELTINADRISHRIHKMWMDGNSGYGKLEIIPTPCGNIARTLIESGVKLGVSSRGSGNVDNRGNVSDYQIITVDIVVNPSAPQAFPTVLYETKNSKRGRIIEALAQAVSHDPKAQKYLRDELLKFIDNLKA